MSVMISCQNPLNDQRFLNLLPAGVLDGVVSLGSLDVISL